MSTKIYPPSYKVNAPYGDAPPPYEVESMVVQAYEEFEKKYKENPMAAEKALADALGNTESSKAFVNDMKRLSLAIGTLNYLFGAVEEGLAKLDALNMQRATGKTPAWQPQWKVIRSAYTDTMLKSRTLATSIADRVKLFFSVVLPKLKNDNMTAQEKDEMLTFFLGEKVTARDHNESLKKDENAVEEMYKAFANIQTEVSTFKGRLEVHSQCAQEQLEEEISHLKGNIDKIKVDLESLFVKKAKIQKAGISMIGVGGMVISTGLLFAPVGAAIAVAGALVTLGGSFIGAALKPRMAYIQASWDNKQAEYNMLLDKEELMKKELGPLVKLLGNDMTKISNQLEIMMGIWSFIKSQAQAARLEVRRPIDDGVPIFLKGELIESSIKAYKVLHTCVKMYGEGYDKR